MKLIDIGANLSSSQFKNDIAQVLERAKDNFIDQIILTTVDADSFNANIKLCSKNSPVPLFTTWGLHPHYAKDLDSFLEKTKVNLETHSNHIKSIGEFGLDFFRFISTQEQQEKAMNYFLDFSKNSSLPLFLHERNAHDAFCSMWKNHNVENKAVVHCFTGSAAEVKDYLDMGMYIGITGWICDERRNHEVIDALKYIPNDKLMIETDSPYLKPRTIKDKNPRNEPANLKVILEKVAELKGIDVEKLNEIIYNNSIEFFNTK